MSNWNKWKHLLVDGEYAERKKILSGLTFEQATRKPLDKTHSIYEELWHTAKWQNIVVNNDEQAYEKWHTGELFPSDSPDSEIQWNELVNEFFQGLDKALEITKSKQEMDKVHGSGVTVADSLYSLAVHNAYHLGKIVSIRQMIGAWTPSESKI